jgi:hypothetical protein
MSKFDIWPNFFIVGVAKAGTTSLAYWLKQHPQIFIPAIKEPRFFAHDLVEPFVRPVIQEEEYLKLFQGAGNYPARGEASTSYFTHWQQVPERIKSNVSDARIIILLRDPVERAHSAWMMNLRHGRETLPFEDAVLRSNWRHWYLRTYTEPVNKVYSCFWAGEGSCADV